MSAREDRTGAGHVAGSPLVRWLRAAAAVEPVRLDFAERLSQWLGPLDAMRLRALHQSLQPVVPVVTSRRQAASDDVGARVAQARASVEQAIQQACVAHGERRPGPDLPDGGTVAPTYAIYRQRHVALQRQMAATVSALRTQLRQALAQASPGARQLATLDAVLEPMTAEREPRLWAGVSAVLAQRFDEAKAQASAAGTEGGDSDWLRRFEQEWTSAVLAEWSARLEPVMGLLNAWRNDKGMEP